MDNVFLFLNIFVLFLDVVLNVFENEFVFENVLSCKDCVEKCKVDVVIWKSIFFGLCLFFFCSGYKELCVLRIVKIKGLN